MRNQRISIVRSCFVPAEDCVGASSADGVSSTGLPLPLLPLSIGDRVAVVSEKSEWAIGRVIGARSPELGLFPVQCLSAPSRSAIQQEEGAAIVDEIDAASQRWWSRIKELYARNTEVEYEDALLAALDAMLSARKKVLSGGCPSDELNSMRAAIARKIDWGNVLLSLDMTIRAEGGVPREPDSLSLIDTFHQHRTAERKAMVDMVDTPCESVDDGFSVLVQVHSTTLVQRYNCEFTMVLYDLNEKKFLSETFTFIWKANDHQFQGGTVKALFTGFTKEDVKRRVILVTRVARIAPLEATSSTLKRHHEPGPASQFCRQMLAFDLLDVSDLFDNPRHSLDHIDPNLNVVLNREDSFEQGWKQLNVTGRVTKFGTREDDARMVVSKQVFLGPPSRLKTKYPHRFARNPPAMVKRTIASDVHGANPRNELYVTLVGAELPGKSSERNLEARLQVVESNGRPVAACFETNEASGARLTSIYHGYVVLQEDKPRWHEQIKIRLCEDTEKDVHLKICIRNRKPFDKNKPEKGPSYLAYARLMDNAQLIRDGEHELNVYKIDSSHFDEQNVTYLSLPQNKKVLGASKPQTSVFSLSEKSSLLIETTACSTILTQNDTLLHLFRWRSNASRLLQCLNEIVVAHGSLEAEIMRFLPTVLDTLFEILDERDSCELSTFDAIVAVLKLTEEPRHSASASALASYIKRFPYTSAAVRLTRCLHSYVTTDDSALNDKARNALKVIGQLFHMIVISKKSADKFGQSSDAEYGAHVDALLDGVVRLMGESKDRMTVQNTALKHLPSIVSPLITSNTYSADKLNLSLIRMMDHFGKNIVARERLGFVSQLIETELFQDPFCRETLLPRCLSLVIAQLESPPLPESREWVERAADCAKILSALIDTLSPQQEQADPVSDRFLRDEELTLLLTTSYRPAAQTLIHLLNASSTDVEDALQLFSSLILSILQKMSAETFKEYVENRVTQIDKLDLLMEMVLLVRDLINKCPFPATWTTMIMMQNKTIHKTLRFVMSAIERYFTNDNYNSELWQEYMLSVVCFVSQASLQSHEDRPAADADTRFKLRKAAASELRSMWFYLNPSQKMNYIPRLVGAFLKVALLDDDETREATIPIFFDMMQCEFHSTQPGRHRNFKRFADELIVQLDCLVEEDRGTRAFQLAFTRVLTKQGCSDPDLWNGGGKDFVARVARLLAHLFEYRMVKDAADCSETTMNSTVQLLRYYEDFSHHDLAISYVYKLYSLHMQHGNEIEAAKTLNLHASTLTWDDSDLPEFLVIKALNRQCRTQRQLKENLLNEIASLLAEGEMWEDSIAVLKELCPVYEKRFIDYQKLAALHERIAALYRKVDMEERAHFYFYHVAFYGTGFPATLNGHKAVFRSDKLERHADFVPRIKLVFGCTDSIMSMDDCSHLQHKPGRHMQIFNVDPITDHCPILDPDVNPAIKNYYRQYNICHFEYSRVMEKRSTKWTDIEDCEVMRTWITRRRLTTETRLPNILRSAKIVSTSDAMDLDPLRRSVEMMKRKNEGLMETAHLVQRNPLMSVMKLSGEIIGVVQAAVMGGVKNYEVFFSEKCARLLDAEEKQLVGELSALIVDQVAVVEYCLMVHGSRPGANRSIHETMLDAFLKHKAYVEDTFGKTTSMLPAGASIHMRPPSLHLPDTLLNPPLAEKKTSGLFEKLDSSTPMGTLTRRGLRTPKELLPSVMANILTPARKSTASAISNGSVSSLRDDTFVGAQVKPAAVAPHVRRQTSGSIDGIKFRDASRLCAAPPPLPARPSASPSTPTRPPRTPKHTPDSKPRSPTPLE